MIFHLTTVVIKCILGKINLFLFNLGGTNIMNKGLKIICSIGVIISLLLISTISIFATETTTLIKSAPEYNVTLSGLQCLFNTTGYKIVKVKILDGEKEIFHLSIAKINSMKKKISYRTSNIQNKLLDTNLTIIVSHICKNNCRTKDKINFNEYQAQLEEKLKTGNEPNIFELIVPSPDKN